jgi:hypothetical protein
MFNVIASGAVDDCAVISGWSSDPCQDNCSVDDLALFEEINRDFCSESEERRGSSVGGGDSYVSGSYGDSSWPPRSSYGSYLDGSSVPGCLFDCDMFDFIASGAVDDCVVISGWSSDPCQDDCSVGDLILFEEINRDFCSESPTGLPFPGSYSGSSSQIQHYPEPPECVFVCDMFDYVLTGCIVLTRLPCFFDSLGRVREVSCFSVGGGGMVAVST